jgi:subtilase family serine protease
MNEPARTRSGRRTSASTFLVTVVTLATLVVPVSVGIASATPAMAHPMLVRPMISPLASPTCRTSELCPSMVQTAYQFTSLLTVAKSNGTGETIVIDDACGDSSIATDVAQFDSTFGLPAVNLSVYTPQGKPCSDPTGWGLETALDVEWAHAMAPNASIALLEAAQPTTTDLLGAWNYSLANSLGNQISNSWGGSGGCPQLASRLVRSAALAHVTVLASSGDSGAWGSGTTQTQQNPADCLGVVTVGGTTLNVNSTGAYSSESAWSGSGGGYSSSLREPAFQVRANITDSYGALGKPDVAAVADPYTGVWVYEKASGGWVVVGGTSVACPIWAAFLADVNSWRSVNGFPALGNLDPFLYQAVYGVNGGSPHYGSTMHDVTSGSNGWSAGTGWDPATGLGSFRAAALAAGLAATRGA